MFYWAYEDWVMMCPKYYDVSNNLKMINEMYYLHFYFFIFIFC